MFDNDELVVAGAGGFIGGHLVAGHSAARLQRSARGRHQAVVARMVSASIRKVSNTPRPAPPRRCEAAADGAACLTTSPPTWAAWGSSRTTRPLCMLSVLINTHLLMAARDAGVERFFFASSACVYNADKQRDPTSPRSRKKTPIRRCRRTVTAGKSCSASGCAAISARTSASHPRRPLSQRLRPARHLDGGREKAPAAICRKVIEAKLSGRHEIEIWGDGEQTRSFMYIDDCLKGTHDDHGQRHRRAAEPRQRRAGHRSTSWWTSWRTSPASS